VIGAFKKRSGEMCLESKCYAYMKGADYKDRWEAEEITLITKFHIATDHESVPPRCVRSYVQLTGMRYKVETGIDWSSWDCRVPCMDRLKIPEIKLPLNWGPDGICLYNALTG
jgi:hypothetical protein